MILSAHSLLSVGLYFPPAGLTEALSANMQMHLSLWKIKRDVWGGKVEKGDAVLTSWRPEGELASSSFYTNSAVTSTPP